MLILPLILHILFYPSLCDIHFFESHDKLFGSPNSHKLNLVVIKDVKIVLLLGVLIGTVLIMSEENS